MGQKVTFDPLTKIIQIDIAPVSGEINIDVKIDIYSDMKEDWRTDSNLLKYRPPLRAVGGDTLPGSKALGATFFLDPNWKIRPYEGDHRFLVNGNLYSEDGTSPYTSTVGTFNVIIESSVSSLVDSTVQQLAEIEYSSFEGGVWFDPANGVNGSGGLIGNAQNPVNNIPDLRVIQAARGLPKTIYQIGSYTFDTGDDISGFKIIGENPARSVIIINSGADTLACEIQEAKVLGNLDGGTILRNCVLDNLNYINGFVYNCMINPGTISLGGLETAHFLSCYSGVPGTSAPTIDMNGVTSEATPLAIRDYSGGIRIQDLDGGAACSIDLLSGQVIIDLTSCTNGNIVIRGSGKVVDQDGNHLASGTYNGNLIVANEANFGGHVHDMWYAMELDTNPNDTIKDMVWNADLSAHNTTGTFGNFIQRLLTLAKWLGLK